MITVEQYFMGRDKAYPKECSPDIRENAGKTIELVNRLLEFAAQDGVRPGINPETRNFVSSGWRPGAVNDATCNASATSKHISARACDLRDTADRALARWCMNNLDALTKIGLWMEDPQWTPTWVHLQTIAPNSGMRVYRPSSAPPKCAPL